MSRAAEFAAWVFTDEHLYQKQLHFGVYGPQDQGAYNEFYQVRGRGRGRIRVRIREG